MDDVKTVSVAVLDCKQNVSFIAFRKVVYFMKGIHQFTIPSVLNPIISEL